MSAPKHQYYYIQYKQQLRTTISTSIPVIIMMYLRSVNLIELWFPANGSAVFPFSCFLNSIFMCSDTTDSLLAQRV